MTIKIFVFTWACWMPLVISALFTRAEASSYSSNSEYYLNSAAISLRSAYTSQAAAASALYAFDWDTEDTDHSSDGRAANQYINALMTSLEQAIADLAKVENEIDNLSASLAKCSRFSNVSWYALKNQSVKVREDLQTIVTDLKWEISSLSLDLENDSCKNLSYRSVQFRTGVLARTYSSLQNSWTEINSLSNSFSKL